jgi:hypothetical protein
MVFDELTPDQVKHIEFTYKACENSGSAIRDGVHAVGALLGAVAASEESMGMIGDDDLRRAGSLLQELADQLMSISFAERNSSFLLHQRKGAAHE